MVRSVTAGVSTALQAASNQPVRFVSLEFPSGTLRYSTFDRDLTVEGNTFTGAGELLSIGAVEETVDIRAAGVEIVLSGAVSAIVTALFDDDYQGKTAQIWLGLIDSAGALIADPLEMPPYRMDASEFSDDPARPTVIIHLESRLRDLLTPRERRWSNEDQKATFSGDTGFRYVEALSDANQRFGGS